MNKLEAKKLQNLLPRGYSAKVSKKLKCSKSLVYKVASGERKNEKVLKELFLLAIELKKRQQKLAKKIKDFV